MYALLLTKERELKRSGTSTMYIAQLVGSVTEDGGFGPRVMGVLASGRRISGPIATAGQLSVAAGAVVARRQVMHASFLLQPAILDPCGQMLQHRS